MAKKSNKLFKDIEVRNSVSRNGFDLSFSHNFTAKCGELLPLFHRTLMPGDKIRIRANSFTRTSPVQTAAFTRINEYFDFFFVPYRLLGKQIPHVLAQDKDNPVIAMTASNNYAVGTNLPRLNFKYLRGNLDSSVPKILGTKTNEFGFYRAILSSKLMNHLGYFWQSTKGAKEFAGITEEGGDTLTPSVYYGSNLDMSLLPLASYQKICYDYYRMTQWENNVPYNYNFDYMNQGATYSVPSSASTAFWNNRTMFDLQYANYPKDLFFGLLPDSQYGDTAVVDVDVNTSNGIYYGVQDTDGVEVQVGASVGGNNTQKAITSGNETILNGSLSVNLESLKGKFDILEFRKARFAQHYREIIGTGSKTMKALIEKIYNVTVPKTLTDECYYLGGHSNVIKISEIENTNLAGDNQAVLKGKGLGSSNGDLIEFEADEYGCIMCIYHASPEITYALNSAHFDVLKISVDDFANPIFDNLGLQELPVYYLDNTYSNNVSQTPFIGWTSRYFDYKTSVDMINGDFRETLSDWVAPLTPQYLFEYDGTNGNRAGIVIDYRFFKVNPKILDSIFAVKANSYLNTDQLRVACDFSINAVRPLSYLGIPRD